MTKAPALSKAAQRRMRKDPEGTVRNWHRDEEAFAFVVADHEARSYVRQVEYWSLWALEDDDGVGQANRDHVQSSRHHEDVQCAKAAVPVGYWLTKADGTSEWIEPDTGTERAKAERVTKATKAAAKANRKGTKAMTGAERVRLNRWRTKASEAGWVCPEHGPATKAGIWTDCTLDCAATHLSERQAATGRKAARHAI